MDKTFNNSLLGQYHEDIFKYLNEFIYRYKRHEIEFSALLIYSNNQHLDLEPIEKNIRTSDKIFKLNDNIFLTVFDVVDYLGGLKASQKIEYTYKESYPHCKIFYAYATIHEKESPYDIVTRLFMALDYAVNESLPNLVVDHVMIRE